MRGPLNFIRNYKSSILEIILIIAMLLAPVIIIYAMNAYGEASTTREYTLSELEDGVYGIYTVVTSSIPAQNYEMITLCVDGQIRTFKGGVNIHYSNDNRLVWKDKNYINCDVLDIYVPYNTIEISPTVGIGSRR